MTEYEERIVCFIDILGFKQHINQTINADGSDNFGQIRNLVESFEVMRFLTGIDKPEDRSEKEVTQFSDSLVISFPVKSESGVFYALLEILWIQINFVLRGILCRGGIARGKLIHTSKLLFGPAIVDAYTLESQAALYPRVILHKSIIDAGIRAHAKHHDPEHEEQSIMTLLDKDSDGMYFIDYITKAQSEMNDPELDFPNYLFQLQKIVESGSKISNPSVAIKYSWLKEKFAPYLERVKNAASNSNIDPELQDAYASIPSL